MKSGALFVQLCGQARSRPSCQGPPGSGGRKGEARAKRGLPPFQTPGSRWGPGLRGGPRRKPGCGAGRFRVSGGGPPNQGDWLAAGRSPSLQVTQQTPTGGLCLGLCVGLDFCHPIPHPGCLSEHLPGLVLRAPGGGLPSTTHASQDPACVRVSLQHPGPLPCGAVAPFQTLILPLHLTGPSGGLASPVV